MTVPSGRLVPVSSRQPEASIRNDDRRIDYDAIGLPVQLFDFAAYSVPEARQEPDGRTGSGIHRHPVVISVRPEMKRLLDYSDLAGEISVADITRNLGGEKRSVTRRWFRCDRLAEVFELSNPKGGGAPSEREQSSCP